jgi:transposase-like protein
MTYDAMKTSEFFTKVKTEEEAQAVAWRAKFGGKEFECPRCKSAEFYGYRTREIRECRRCHRHVRLRKGTLWESSKLPMLTWVRAIFLMMQDKRGVSALQLKRQLGMPSYGTAWKLQHKIRRALRERDEQYTLRGVVELDGAHFQRIAKGSEATVALIAVESKEWVDEKGRPKSRAGFAKVEVTGSESFLKAQRFVAGAIERNSFVSTDGSWSLRQVKGVEVDYHVTHQQAPVLDRWLPWVHRFVSNAKAWLLGTHHGISAKYLPNYLAEHAYRFNRRHDPDSLFHRALRACALAPHVLEPALFG